MKRLVITWEPSINHSLLISRPSWRRQRIHGYGYWYCHLEGRMVNQLPHIGTWNPKSSQLLLPGSVAEASAAVHLQIRYGVPSTMYAKMALHQLANGGWLAIGDPKRAEIRGNKFSQLGGRGRMWGHWVVSSRKRQAELVVMIAKWFHFWVLIPWKYPLGTGCYYF